MLQTNTTNLKKLNRFLNTKKIFMISLDTSRVCVFDIKKYFCKSLEYQFCLILKFFSNKYEHFANGS